MQIDLAQLRELYDQEERRSRHDANMRREELPNLVRYVSTADTRSCVLYSRLGAAEVDQAAREQIAYFRALGHTLEWKVYAHDTPHDLKERLRARGFAVGEAESVMVFDTDSAPPALLRPPSSDIRPITEMAGLADVIAVEDKVWNTDHGWITQRFGPHLNDPSASVLFFVAYVGGQPASTAWITFNPGSHFAGLWGGSTLVEHRGRGLYTDLLAARVQAARQRGVRFLTVDAGPMSRPILERHGFQTITQAYECLWHP
ncbi:MAG TPA: GNAT family N-acetyltransferase [Roseiflexaceae bacterium]|nr:GNAT family N-acetyltransferase [Roseiflexaceae bacterium]